MQKLLLMVAACGLCAPAMAQTTPQQPAADQANAVQAAPQKTVRKQVCQKVSDERSTGSRLGSTTRICKIVEVPVADNDAHAAPHTSSPNR